MPRGGLVRAVAAEPNFARFAAGVLEEVPSVENANSLWEIARIVETDADALHECLSAMNITLTFGLEQIPDTLAAASRRELHRYAHSHRHARTLATIFYAARRVGDAETVSLLEDEPDLPEPWSDAKQLALREIRRRLRR
jgi:hypothetical protein